VTAPDVVLALTTCADEATAAALVRELVERRLVACGTMLPGARSIYRWQGAVEDATEVMVVLKTSSERVSALQDAVRELHRYDVPELVVIPVIAALAPYAAWVRESVDEP
jgi:periplasmic divalent cation tolerance protein